MIKIFSLSKKELKEINSKEISKDKNTSYWIDFTDSNSGEIKLIRDLFDIHPTTEEDILSNQTRTKYEEFEENTTIIFHGIKRLGATSIKTYNLSFIIGKNYLITSHLKANESIDFLINNKRKLGNLMEKGIGYVFHHLLDKEIDKGIQIKRNIFEKFKQLERKFINNPEGEVLEELFEKELIIIEMGEVMESLTDLCFSLTKQTDNYIDNELLPYFRDIYDHSFKTTESLISMLKRINGMRNAYQTMTSNRLNETMKILTMIMAIMMPFTIVSGFYGMNVGLPFKEDPNVWIVLLIAMMGISTIMYFIIKRIKVR